MRTRIRKWGNSLALRIPTSLAAAVRLQQGSSVELSLVEGKLVVSPDSAPELTLEHLLAQITQENLHRELEVGPPTGQEVW